MDTNNSDGHIDQRSKKSQHTKYDLIFLDPSLTLSGYSSQYINGSSPSHISALGRGSETSGVSAITLLSRFMRCYSEGPF